MEPRLDAAGLHRTGAGGRPVRHGRGQGLREGAAPSDHPPVLPGRWRGFPPGPAAVPTQVTEGGYDHGEVDWSPRGELLTFVAARHTEHDDDLVGDVWVVAPDGSGLRVLTDSSSMTE